MSLKTTWGYTLTDADELEVMLSTDEFNELTANKYAGDERILPNIKAACMAIRNYCGWHIYPEESCEYSERILTTDGRIKKFFGDILIQLPATFVSSVESVTIDGEEWTDYDISSTGLLQLFDVSKKEVTRKTVIEVSYTAGIEDAIMEGLKELIAHRVTHALASTAGIQSETAGGVSVTYSANWINSARSTALASDNKEVLAPYRLQGVF